MIYGEENLKIIKTNSNVMKRDIQKKKKKIFEVISTKAKKKKKKHFRVKLRKSHRK